MDYKISRKDALALLRKFDEEETLVRALMASPDLSITISIVGILWISERGDLNIAVPGAGSAAATSGIALSMDWLTSFAYQDLKDASLSAEEREKMRQKAGVSQLKAGLSNGWSLAIFEREAAHSET